MFDARLIFLIIHTTTSYARLFAYTFIEVSPPFYFLPLSLSPFLHSQELLYVVPFVAKVLESCAESRVFKPPNPWTMAIMSVLSEMHSAPDLKLNLRFEV